MNCLGNLTLLSKKFNIALSNRPWTDSETTDVIKSKEEAGLGKRSLVQKYSLMLLSKELVSENVEAWTDEAIEARSVYLTGKICEIWPRPEKRNE